MWCSMVWPMCSPWSWRWCSPWCWSLCCCPCMSCVIWSSMWIIISANAISTAESLVSKASIVRPYLILRTFRGHVKTFLFVYTLIIMPNISRVTSTALIAFWIYWSWSSVGYFVRALFIVIYFYSAIFTSSTITD